MIEQEIENLSEQPIDYLREQYARYFNVADSNKNKSFYISRLAYRMQELEYGGLTMSTKRLLEELSNNSKPKPKKGLIAPVGTRIIKTFKNKDYTITVLEKGYSLDDKFYKSLSAMAKNICGMKVSGKHFFGLGTR